jgi:hypothetical protein
MRPSVAIILALVTAVMAVTPAFAYYHYRHGYAIAPYGHAVPHYTSRYGRYPSYTYDPDPRLRGMLRSDFNRGVDTPSR